MEKKLKILIVDGDVSESEQWRKSKDNYQMLY